MKNLLFTTFLIIFGTVSIQGSTKTGGSKVKVLGEKSSTTTSTKRISLQPKAGKVDAEKMKAERALKRNILNAATTYSTKVKIDLSKSDQLEKFWEYANSENAVALKEPKKIAEWSLQRMKLERVKVSHVRLTVSELASKKKKPRQASGVTGNVESVQASDSRIKPSISNDKTAFAGAKRKSTNTDGATTIIQDPTAKFAKPDQVKDMEAMLAALRIWGAEPISEEGVLQSLEKPAIQGKEDSNNSLMDITALPNFLNPSISASPRSEPPSEPPSTPHEPLLVPQVKTTDESTSVNLGEPIHFSGKLIDYSYPSSISYSGKPLPRPTPSMSLSAPNPPSRPYPSISPKPFDSFSPPPLYSEHSLTSSLSASSSKSPFLPSSSPSSDAYPAQSSIKSFFLRGTLGSRSYSQSKPYATSRHSRYEKPSSSNSSSSSAMSSIRYPSLSNSPSSFVPSPRLSPLPFDSSEEELSTGQLQMRAKTTVILKNIAKVGDNFDAFEALCEKFENVVAANLHLIEGGSGIEDKRNAEDRQRAEKETEKLEHSERELSHKSWKNREKAKRRRLNEEERQKAKDAARRSLSYMTKEQHFSFQKSGIEALPLLSLAHEFGIDLLQRSEFGYTLAKIVVYSKIMIPMEAQLLALHELEPGDQRMPFRHRRIFRSAVIKFAAA